MVGTILLANVLNVSAQGTTRKIITEKKTSQGRMVDPQSEVITAPQIAELEVSQTKCDTTFRFDHDGTVDLQNARALALSAFQKHHDADIIVGALMNTRMKDSLLVIAKYVLLHGKTCGCSTLSTTETKVKILTP